MSDDTTARAGVRPPGSAATRPGRAPIARDVERWLAEAHLDEIVTAFGGQLQGGSTAQQLQFLDRFSAEHWNPRANTSERDQIGDYPLSAEQSSIALETAQALGLTTSTEPAAGAYDHMLVLGGLARACLLRPRYAAELVARGLGVGSVAALTGFRELSGGEFELLRNPQVNLDADNELQVMAEGMRRAFRLTEAPASSELHEDPNPFLSTRCDRWSTSNFPVDLMVAPSGAPDRRANSADTYEWWAELVRPAEGERVLLITSAIYVPYQGAHAVRVLGLGHELLVETIGLDAAAPEFGVLRQRFTPAHYLQEIRSAVLGARALYEAATHL